MAFGLVRLEKSLIKEKLIREGFVWVYRKYCTLPLCSDKWDGLELKARSGKLGLWGDSDHIPPWEFRRDKRKYAVPVLSLNAN